eukprot:COSAG01_NODE_4688_length_4811_cov_3.539588_3_plen_209_part_00
MVVGYWVAVPRALHPLRPNTLRGRRDPTDDRAYATPAGAGGDNGIAKMWNRSEIPVSSYYDQSHYLHPHPYVCQEHGHDSAGDRRPQCTPTNRTCTADPGRELKSPASSNASGGCGAPPHGRVTHPRRTERGGGRGEGWNGRWSLVPGARPRAGSRLRASAPGRASHPCTSRPNTGGCSPPAPCGAPVPRRWRGAMRSPGPPRATQAR